MPARKTTSTKTSSEKSSPPKKEYVEVRIPKLAKGSNVFMIFLVIVLMLLSFAVGMMYMKIQALEQGGSVTAQQATTVQGAFEAYAKQVKLDVKKFTACIADKKYEKRVTDQTAEGTSLGVHATPTFYINGKLIGGAYPYEAFKDVIDKEIAGTGSENPADYIEMLQQAYADEANRSFDPVPKQITVTDEPVRGDKNAKVTIVEYSDFQCPFCQRAVATVDQVLQDYKGQVKLVYKHYPITSIHPNAQGAAEATECAREQGKFWEYHDLLFKNQTTWSNLPQALPA